MQVKLGVEMDLSGLKAGGQKQNSAAAVAFAGAWMCSLPLAGALRERRAVSMPAAAVGLALRLLLSLLRGRI
eukprot:scaffold131157_cov14-Tisochrysis_lutea.AAC.1